MLGDKNTVKGTIVIKVGVLTKDYICRGRKERARRRKRENEGVRIKEERKKNTR